uniref:ANK_REP_REGION domain-containing protein n=1 Tax=Macrostomum lignano TaxID=282301 RepID=A0A1I8I2A7_9PLAT
RHRLLNRPALLRKRHSLATRQAFSRQLAASTEGKTTTAQLMVDRRRFTMSSRLQTSISGEAFAAAAAQAGAVDVMADCRLAAVWADADPGAAGPVEAGRAAALAQSASVAGRAVAVTADWVAGRLVARRAVQAPAPGVAAPTGVTGTAPAFALEALAADWAADFTVADAATAGNEVAVTQLTNRGASGYHRGKSSQTAGCLSFRALGLDALLDKLGHGIVVDGLEEVGRLDQQLRMWEAGPATEDVGGWPRNWGSERLAQQLGIEQLSFTVADAAEAPQTPSGATTRRAAAAPDPDSVTKLPVQKPRLLVEDGGDIREFNRTLMSFEVRPAADLFSMGVTKDSEFQTATSEYMLPRQRRDWLEHRATVVLFIACHRGYYELARRLLQSGANVNCQTGAGRTPLHVAAAVDNCDIVDLLLENGANTDLTDSGVGSQAPGNNKLAMAGKTAHDLAAAAGHKACERRLFMHRWEKRVYASRSNQSSAASNSKDDPGLLVEAQETVGGTAVSSAASDEIKDSDTKKRSQQQKQPTRQAQTRPREQQQQQRRQPELVLNQLIEAAATKLSDIQPVNQVDESVTAASAVPPSGSTIIGRRRGPVDPDLNAYE